MLKQLFNKLVNLFKSKSEEFDSPSQILVSNTASGFRIKVGDSHKFVSVYADASGVIYRPNHYHGYKVHNGWITIRKNVPNMVHVSRKSIRTYKHTDGMCFFWCQVGEKKDVQ